MDNSLRICIRFKNDAVCHCQIRPQAIKIFNDAVMHNGYIAITMRMGIAHIGDAMGGPARILVNRLSSPPEFGRQQLFRDCSLPFARRRSMLPSP